METPEVAESPMDDRSRTPVEPQTEPPVESDASNKNKQQKKKKKKKKNRRKSLEGTQSEGEEMQQTEKNPEPEEEGDETNQKQEEDSIEESTVVEEASIEDTTVGEEASVQETMVAKEASIEEATVMEESSVETTADVPVETTSGQETSIEETAVETTKESAVVEKEDRHEDELLRQEADASGDELGPPSLERKTSVDSFKATGTRAVGSLFSRFKVGRKKPLPSGTESAAKLELANPSPVKTAVKRLEVPEEKNLDDLPMRTKRDFFGEGEQSIHVSAEKDKYNKMENQRRAEKEADEAVRAAVAAKQTPPSSSSSKEDLLAQISDAVKDEVVANISGVESSVVNQVTESMEKRVSGVSDTVVDVSTSEAPEIVVDAATVTTVESGVPEVAEPEVAQTVKTSVEELSVLDSELAADTVVEGNEKNSDATMTVPVSLKLDLDLDINTEPNQSFCSIKKVAAGTTESEETATKTAESNEIVQEKSSSSQETAILTVKVAPPASDVGTEVSPPAKPERMSPVKSLASRFEGKREQSLDSLKFRTVREFFPEERSIRVGTEKQKYEALKEQQKLKAKAEEEAKQKYNLSKSPVKEIVAASTSTQRDTAVSTEMKSTNTVNPAPVADVLTGAGGAAFSTPETVASRKKFSFDEGYAGTNSPAKFTDDASEALTPVKSIASRFEGKSEQSLDSLKFRTVREFFPEERSVRVGSEKQKFEAQALAQQQNSLDKLKFRTVREFFPSEDKRSVHVGAEKAKFEALSKQQEEAAKEAEQLKQKHAAVSPPPPTVEIDPYDAVPAVSKTIQVSSSTLDESHAEIKLNSTESTMEPTSDETTKPANESEVEESVAGISDSKSNEVVLAAPSVLENVEAVNLSTTSNGHESASKENLSPEVTDNQLGTTGGAESIELVVAGELEDTKGANKVEVSSSSAVNGEEIDEQDVKHDAEQQVKHETDFDLKKTIELKVKIEEEQHDENLEQQIAEEVDQKEEEHVGGDAKLGEMDLEEHIVKTQTEPVFDAIWTGTDFNEQVTINTLPTEEESVVVIKVEREVASDGLAELHLGEPVAIDPVDPAVSTLQHLTGEEVHDFGAQPIEKKPEVESGLVDLDLGSPTAEQPDVVLQEETESKSRPMLTTERSFVMEDDHTIETQDTVVVSERPMTDGEDEFEPLSPSKVRSASELFTGISSTNTKKSSSSVEKTLSNDSKTAPKLTRKVSASSTGSAKSSTTVPVPMKRASITAPTASSMAKKATEGDELHKSSPQLKKKVSASKLKGTVSDTGFVKPPPAAPTVPVAMKRASITAPTASYEAKKAAEAEEARRISTLPKQRHSTSKQKGTVTETGFIKPPPAAPTVPVPMKRASVTAPTASQQARHVVNLAGGEGGAHAATRNRTTKTKGAPLTVPAPPKRASIMAPTVSYMTKKSAENAGEDRATTSSVPTRNKRYSNVKSKFFEGIESGSMHAVTHKTITKEEFIAAERRKSLGSGGVRSVLNAVDRRASLAARVTIDGPPEPFLRSASSRKKLDSTVPRYMNYENTPGYAERARQQYERRKRLEEENAAKSEKRQKELRMHFAEKQQKALKLSAEEVRRGLEAHEFSRLAKESEITAQKSLRKEKQRASSIRNHHRPSSTTSGSSSNGFVSRISKKSSVSSVEGKVVAATLVETPPETKVLETVEVVESSPAAIDTIESPQDEVVSEVQEVIIEAAQVEEQTSPAPLVDEDPALEHVAKKIDFDEASTDSFEKGDLIE